ncbi:hypothetical protein D7Y09_07855 [bacterium 1XD42-1]|nr:hypothetical protein D7Y09_07855 [bacterium 1XD42-1]
MFRTGSRSSGVFYFIPHRSKMQALPYKNAKKMLPRLFPGSNFLYNITYFYVWNPALSSFKIPGYH